MWDKVQQVQKFDCTTTVIRFLNVPNTHRVKPRFRMVTQHNSDWSEGTGTKIMMVCYGFYSNS